IFANVLELKTLRQIEVSLHCSQLPQTANRVFDLEIDLRPVESRLAFDALVFDTARVESHRHFRFSFLPVFFRPNIELVGVASLHRKLKLNLVETEGLEHLISEVNAIEDLVLHLLRRTEQVRVIDGESTYAHQAVQRAGQFCAIHRTHFAVTLRPITIGTLLIFVYDDE